MNLPNQSEMAGYKPVGKYIDGIYRQMFGVVVYKSWAEMFQLEVLLNTYSFSTIIELGTGFGATAILLGVHSHMRGAKVFSYDNKPTVTPPVQRLYDALGVTFEVMDIFENVAKIAELIRLPGRTLLYCDNGDKSKELEIWGKYLKSGDIALVHDYPEEITDATLDRVCSLGNLARFQEEWFKSYCSSHRAVVRI
jgi:cephalosporin hydroxylase